MNRRPKDSLSDVVKTLTEQEIQKRLYGKYLGRREGGKSSVTSEAVMQTAQQEEAPAAPISQDASALNSEWTGAEILEGELKRLRSELIALRQERERLAAELKRHIGSSERMPMALEINQKKSVRDILRKVTITLILAGCIGMPIGFRFLQASPAGGDPSPYTIQVAAYDVKSLTDQAVTRLQQMGYSAFFVKTPRPNGKSRYRIYVGRFVTREEADLERERLIMDPRFSDAFVRLQ